MQRLPRNQRKTWKLLMWCLTAAVPLIGVMFAAHLVLPNQPAHFAVEAAEALLGIALIIAAVCFVLEVVGKVMEG